MPRRGKLPVRVTIDEKGITRKLQRAMKSALADAGDDIATVGTKTAKRRIRQRGAMWKHELLHSFRSSNIPQPHGRRVRIYNTAEHAPYVEYGTEHYTRAPPLKALLPWVVTELQGWTVVDGRLVPE